jgi:AmiR/NasT family two-component response regulator
MKSDNNQIYVLSNRDRDILSISKVVNRLGFLTTQFNNTNLPKDNNTIIFDVATALELKDKSVFEHKRPLIALVSHATPSEIQHTMELGAYAVITRPIHQLGLLSALQVSRILFKKIEDQDNQYANLKRKHLSRCSVIKTVILFMEEFNVNDQKAYEIIRNISMTKNIELEKFCKNLVENRKNNHVYNKEA